MNSIIILGGGGQLALALKETLQTIMHYSVKAFSKSEADITDINTLKRLLNDDQPSIVINCAALTDVDEAEQKPELAFRVNETGVRNIGTAIKETSPETKLIHFSTDYVFNGKDAPESGYRENSHCSPVNIYGVSKRRGELVLLEDFPEIPFLIIRVSWLYGEGESSFLYKFLNQASSNKVLRVVNNIKGSPTSTLQVANFLLEIIRQNVLFEYLLKERIIHFSGRGKISWYEFAKEIKLIYQLPNKIIPISHSEFPTFAKRPIDTYLSSEKLDAIIPIGCSWKIAFKQFINRQKM